MTRNQIDEFFVFVARTGCDGAMVKLDPTCFNKHGARLTGVCERCAAVSDTIEGKDPEDAAWRLSLSTLAKALEG